MSQYVIFDQDKIRVSLRRNYCQGSIMQFSILNGLPFEDAFIASGRSLYL